MKRLLNFDLLWNYFLFVFLLLHYLIVLCTVKSRKWLILLVFEWPKHYHLQIYHLWGFIQTAIYGHQNSYFTRYLRMTFKDNVSLNHISNLQKNWLKGSDTSFASLPLYQSSVSALPAQFKFCKGYGHGLKIYHL